MTGALARRNRTRAWYPAFLEAFRNSCNIRASAQAAGVGRSTVYEARADDPEFAAALAEAESDAVDVLEAAARARALTVSDNLLIFLLKAHRPNVYHERVEQRVTADISGSIQVEDVTLAERLGTIIAVLGSTSVDLIAGAAGTGGNGAHAEDE